MARKLALALCLILLPVTIYAGRDIMVPNGFWSGNDWQNNEPMKYSYAMGVVDGMVLGSTVERNGASMDWLKPCLKGKNSNQLLRVIQREVDEHPDLLHDSMHMIAYRALVKSCQNSPKFTPEK